MTYLIGIDEAGYGPNLGPLVIAGSLWKLPASAPSKSLYQLLEPNVAAAPGEDRLTICDSKRLHKPHATVGPLEEHILPAWMNTSTWESRAKNQTHSTLLPHVVDHLELGHLLVDAAPSGCSDRLEVPGQRSLFPVTDQAHLGSDKPDGWYYTLPDPVRLPIAGCPQLIATRAAALRQALASGGVALIGIKFTEISPRLFNRLLERTASKGALLTHVSLGLVSVLMQRCDEVCPIEIVCDKHGGRNRYGEALQAALPGHDWKVVCESSAGSHYTGCSARGQSIQLAFQARGESHLPTALASMAAKYIREIRMDSWNRFWKRQVPGLRPTKGYPVDAKRFMVDIEPALAELDVPPEDVWRAK